MKILAKVVFFTAVNDPTFFKQVNDISHVTQHRIPVNVIARRGKYDSSRQVIHSGCDGKFPREC